jgi:hypothetical protein
MATLISDELSDELCILCFVYVGINLSYPEYHEYLKNKIHNEKI